MSKFAGCRSLELTDGELGRTFPALILYPTESPERSEHLGTYAVEVAMNGPVAPGPHPLVVISHGTGGSHLLHRGLAAHLARQGFVVVLPEHPLDNRNNNELAGTAANLANRPRHVRQVIDWAYADRVFGPQLARDTVAIIGHSQGGYTALALAGGRPVAFPNETEDHQPHPVDVVADDRVKALVLLAPATPWFMEEGALKDVRVPILMLTGQKDQHTPLWQAEIVKNGVPDSSLVEHRPITNAGHFSFLSPFPPQVTNPAFPPSQDPPGFDRPRFHEQMNVEILAFLRRAL